MPTPYTDDVRLAHVLADDADSLTMDRFRSRDLRVSKKPDMTEVTDADEAVEEAIRRTLGRSRSRDVVQGEEFGVSGGTGVRRWIIDPIDGTRNYLRGVPVWATLIALVDEDEVVASCVSAPALGRRWWASKDGGAWTGKSLMSARQCRVSHVDSLSDASLAYSSIGGWEDIGKLEQFLTLARRVWRTRAYGDFWSYMLLAEGAVDVAAEPELAVWDMAALDVIVREAGGLFGGLDGSSGPWAGNALATNGHLHEDVMAFLGHFPDRAPTSPQPESANVTELTARRRPPESSD